MVETEILNRLLVQDKCTGENTTGSEQCGSQRLASVFFDRGSIRYALSQSVTNAASIEENRGYYTIIVIECALD